MERDARVWMLGLALAASAALSATARAERPSDYRTIESEHFIIHYYVPLDDVARRVASLCERAHATLTPALATSPSERTHVVLTDASDSSNGSAQTTPRNVMSLIVTAPEGLSQLMDHDDWLYGLIVHEYAHIVHLDYAVGLAAIVNKVFGKMWNPNQVQPRWVIEGLATYEESKRTSGGRNRYAEFAADLRMLSITNTEQSVDQISNGVRLWPHGTTAYEHGGAFFDYVFKRYGDDKAAALSRIYGSNPVPWSFNRSFEEATGQTMTALWSEFSDYVRGEAAMTIEAIERSGRRDGARLTFSGETNLSPRFRRDDPSRVTWLRNDGKNDSAIVEIDVKMAGASPVEFMNTGRIIGYANAPDGSTIFAQSQTYDDFYGFRDLVRFDPLTRRYRKLTTRLRATDPAISHDGKNVAFVVNNAGQRRLAISPIGETLVPRFLWTGGRYDQAYEPAWSGDGRQVAFSAWREGGFRDILIADIETGDVFEVGKTRAQDLTPVYDPLGRYLYFVSDRTGVYNVFAVELASLPSLRVWQVTNVVGGAIQPDVSPDGQTLLFQGMVGRGYEVFSMPLDPATFTVAAPYINDRPDPVIVRSDEAPVTEPRPFRPLETLAPQSYSVQLIIDSFGQAASLETSGADVLGRHNYTLATTLSLEDRNVNIASRYTYARLWPNLTASLSRRANRRGGFIIDGINRRYTEEEIAGSVAASLRIFNLAEHQGTLRFDYDVRRVRNIDDPFVDFDPNEQVPEFPETDATLAGIGVRWGISSARGFTHTVGPVLGTNLVLSAALDHPMFGSDFTTLTLRYDGNVYGRLPRFDDVSIFLRLSGGIGLSDRRRSPTFGLGGVRDQEIIDSVINTIRTPSTGYLRGFDTNATAGTTFHLANFELRRELVTIERGLESLPVYIRRLHVAALLDVGNTWRDEVDFTDLRLGVGGALRLDALFGYFAPGSFDIGYARGFGAGGLNEVWFLLTSTI